MLKRGITRRGEWARRALAQEAAHRGWWPFAYTLLAEIHADYTTDDEPLLERLYRSMAAGDGVWKITQAGRFEDVDERIEAELVGRFAGNGEVAVHDMAASNAITSLHLFQRLEDSLPVTLYASDYFDRLYFVRPHGWDWMVVFDVTGRPLQFVGRGFVLSGLRWELRRHPVNRWWQRRVQKRIRPLAEDMLQQYLSTGHARGGTVEETSLFHPLCQLRREDPDGRFRLMRHDVFQPNPIPCDLVRAMNVLTPHHFDHRRLQAAVSACVVNLHEGGVLVMGRSIDEKGGQAATTAFEKAEGRLRPLWSLHGGCEIADIVTALELPALQQVS